MRYVKKWLSEMFEPEQAQDLDISMIVESLTDMEVRNIWMESVFEQIKTINLEIDKRMLSGDTQGIQDLCVKRRTIQELLESILSARRTVLGKSQSHNPRPAYVNLDRVTA